MSPKIESITDPLIREGITAAVQRTLLPAMAHPAYPGHFCVTADGSHFGSENTWPGLDSWEIAGAYLLLGYEQVVLNYFAFVRASQRPDGNIPFAIFPADSPPEAMDTYLRALRYPQDIYTYAPANSPSRRWIGLFHHWQTRVNPLSVLAVISYILTADEIVASGASPPWLNDNLPSIESAARHLLSRKSPNGLVAGAGFYIECPPRDQWDGITQCYAIHAFRAVSRLCRAASTSRDREGAVDRATFWESQADQLTRTFHQIFWTNNHFAEYVHPTHGLIDRRPLTDVNFAAIGLNIATNEQSQILWPRLLADKSFRTGGIPTQLASYPSHYEPWELPEPLPFTLTHGPLYDVAAMGRVWYLESLACRRMNQWDRLIESTRQVCQTAKQHNWQWHERYHATPDGNAIPAGPAGYCEYAAILVRVVLSNIDRFSS